MSINIEKSRKLALVVDMYGCPNRCRHCWLGRLPNIPPENGADEMLVNSFRPYFEQIEYYSWLREPDFCGEYRARWERDKALSVNCEPQRFELASFWRLVRDGEYAKFLREVGVKVVQLTFFGGEETTDRYIGRKGAYSELLKATEILLQNGIAASVIAADLRERPLSKARTNAQRYGVAEKIRFALSDGLEKIPPDEVDTIVCAGMGGDLIARIVADCAWVRDPRYLLILQPQSSGADLRRRLA